MKALSDVICTSGNAVKIVRAAPADRNILFVPDQNLGQWVIEQTGRPMELWQGNCYVHVEFTRQSIERVRDRNTRPRPWWPTRSALRPCACWRMRFAPRKR